MNRASVCPDAPLLSRCQPNNPRSVASKKNICSSTYSYPLVSLPIVLIRSPVVSECAAASETHRSVTSLAKHGARPPPSRGARLSSLPGATHCCPLQAVRLQPRRRSCGRCLPSVTCSHCRRPTTYKRRRGAASGEPHTSTNLHSVKLQVDIALKAHFARVYFNCFRCFRDMLQVLHMDVAKIDHDVVHVAMVVHICCKRPFQMFHLLFQTYVASVTI
jgi:hypothetical protein